jgi:hypothetical protein
MQHTMTKLVRSVFPLIAEVVINLSLKYNVLWRSRIFITLVKRLRVIIETVFFVVVVEYCSKVWRKGSDLCNNNSWRTLTHPSFVENTKLNFEWVIPKIRRIGCDDVDAGFFNLPSWPDACALVLQEWKWWENVESFSLPGPD